MQTNTICIREYLKSLPVDVQHEQDLLGHLSGSDRESILVIGDQAAAPFTLLPLEETMFLEQEVPAFPLQLEYGDAFSILATNTSGERERYYSVSDFRRFCADRFDQIICCTVYLPHEFLRDLRLVYFIINENLNRLNTVAKGCTGCVMAVAADAGGLSEDYMALCSWLKDERCISERVSMILRYRNSFCNDMLGYMAGYLLERENIGTFFCGDTGEVTLPEISALRSAVLDVQQYEMDASQAGVLRQCRSSVEQKLKAALLAQQSEKESSKEIQEKYENAGRVFEAMCITERYSISNLLTDVEKESLRREIRDFFTMVRGSFPQMVDEVLAKSKKPKTDLKNMAGDYLGDVIDAFVGELIEEVSAQLMIPRTHERFQNVCIRFRRMMQDAQLEHEQLEKNAEAELLRMANINIGNYQAPLAQVISTILSSVVKYFLLKELTEWGFGDLSYVIVHRVERIIDSVVSEVSDALMSKKQYVGSLKKKLLEDMEDLQTQIYEQLELTIIPRLGDVLQKEFDNLTNVYHEQLLQRAGEAAEQQEAARQQIRILEHALTELEVVFP